MEKLAGIYLAAALIAIVVTTVVYLAATLYHRYGLVGTAFALLVLLIPISMQFMKSSRTRGK